MASVAALLLGLRCASGLVLPPRLAPAVTARRSAIDGIAAEFPALDQVVNGRKLIYFDSGATAQKPRAVLDALAGHYERDNANVHRGAHELATRATDAYEGARESVARFVGGERDEIVWTRGATEAINLVAHGWGDAHVGAGDEILLTACEHHSNLVPWQLLAARVGATVKYARLRDDGAGIDEAHLLSLIGARTKVVGIVHVSNVLASSAPVAAVVAAVRSAAAKNAVVLLDACQSAPHAPLDATALGVDFLVASGHKMCGPTGIGFLWGKAAVLDAMRPWQGGGEMIGDVYLDDGETTFAAPPARFEAGTPPIAEAVGLGAACEYLDRVGMVKIEAHERDLAAALHDGLAARDRVTIYGPKRAADRSAAIVAFSVDGVHPSDLAFFLDRVGVAVRAGHHCTQPLHARLDAPGGTCRASLALYNTLAEVDDFLARLDEVLDDVFAEDDALAPLDLDAALGDAFVPLDIDAALGGA